MSNDEFYRRLRKGLCRTSGHMTAPPVMSKEDLRLPTNIAVHVVPVDDVRHGPEPFDLLINDFVERKVTVLVEHTEALKTMEGRPRYLNGIYKKETSVYHRKYRALRPLKRRQIALDNLKIPVIVSHLMLYHTYRYTRSLMSDIWRRFNIWNTVVDSLNGYANDSARMQCIECGLPDKSLTFEEMEVLILRLRRDDVESINDRMYFIASLYRWLSGKVDGEFDTLLKLNEKAIESTVLFWVVDKSISVMPLKLLDQLRTNNPQLACRQLIQFLSAMIEYKVVDIEEEAVDVVEEEEDIPQKLNEEIAHQAEVLAETGQITAREYTRLIKLSEHHAKLSNPLGEGSLVEMASKANELANKEPDSTLVKLDTMNDDSMANSTLKGFDSEYVADIMQADVANMVLSLQNSGVAITNYKMTKMQDAANNNYRYSVQLTPLIGKPSTVSFQLPIIEPDGTFLSGGVKMRMDKQRFDMPIRKVGPSKVVLTSYYGKFYIERIDRLNYNYGRWLTQQIIKLDLSDSEFFSSLTTGDVFDNELTTPKVYSSMSMRIKEFKYKGYSIGFIYKDREQYIKDNSPLTKYERNGSVITGSFRGDVVTIGKDDIFYRHTDSGIDTIGTIDDLLDNKIGNGPVDAAAMKVFGKMIPVGFILAYRKGLTKLIAKLGASYRTVAKGTRASLDVGEYSIAFSDVTYIFDRSDRSSSMILAGLNVYKDSVSKYEVSYFDKQEVYLNILEHYSLGLRHLKEINLFFQLFIDPITLDILESIEEPTTVNGLMHRSVELLLNDHHARETDMSEMRIRGYERLPGLVYNEMVKSIREFNGKAATKERKIEMNPHAIKMAIVEDPSGVLVEDLNPINNLKEKERITFSGIGGRSAETMVRRHREFHPNDQGVISEATLDSGKAGITNYSTANPNFVNYRGVTRRLKSDDGMAQQASTTMMLLPCTDRDDPKRTNFVNVQYTHTIAVEGNDIQPIRTGYEEVIAHRSDSIYASVAKQDGVIDNITKSTVVVKYKDGGEDRFPIGTIYGKVSSIQVPHILVCDRDVGYKFKKDEVLVFNSGYFKRDYFNPDQVCFLSGYMATIALLESTDTLEDSCAISEKASKMMTTTISVSRDIMVDFNQSVHNLVEVGDKLDKDTTLCIIEDELTSKSSLFDEESLSTLNLLSANSPKAKENGIVNAIEVLYYGDTDDLSESLLKIIKKYDAQRSKLVRERGLDRSLTGELNDIILVGGRRITANTVIIKLTIDKALDAGVGDKGVVANQLKTVVGRKMIGINETESGIPIDVIFGFQSISNRIVLSPEIAGTVNSTMEVIGKKMAEIYWG